MIRYLVLLPAFLAIVSCVPTKREAPLICPTGYKKFHESCFKLFTTGATWSQARAICRGLPKDLGLAGKWLGHIAEIREDSIPHFLLGLIAGAGAGGNKFWLGATSSRTGNREFRWDTDLGLADNYLNWGRNEPSAYRSTQACLLLDQPNEGVADSSCIAKQPFICAVTRVLPEDEDLYWCDPFPWNGIAHSQPVATFDRLFKAQVPLVCELGYRPDEKYELLEVRCERDFTSGRLKWTPCGGCVEVDPYCRTNPSDVIKNTAALSRSAYTAKVSDTAVLTCNTGFEVSGGGRLIARCRAKTVGEGEWFSPKSCIYITTYCDAHPHAAVVNSLAPTTTFSRTLDTRLNLKCKKGFVTKNRRALDVICTAHKPRDGIWLPNTECSEIQTYCDEHPSKRFANSVNPPKGTFGRTLNAQVSLDCELGYFFPDGKSILASCSEFTESNGQWTSRGNCKILHYYCDPEPWKSIQFSRGGEGSGEDEFARSVGSEVNLECLAGYRESVKGRLFVSCIGSTAHAGKWDAAGRRCTLIPNYCHDTPHAGVDHTVPPRFGSFATSVDSSLELNCRLGYRPNLHKSIQVTCVVKTNDRGEWYTQQYCEIINEYCTRRPESIIIGVLPPAPTSYTRKIGDTVTLSCLKGYRGDGLTDPFSQFTASCQPMSDDEGTWWTHVRCVPIVEYCDDHPESLIKAGIPPRHFTRFVGSKVLIDCAPGWVSTTGRPVEVTCLPHNDHHGEWTAVGECHCPAKTDAKKKKTLEKPSIA